MSLLRFALAAALAVGAPAAAFAAASSVPANYTPDPALKTTNRAQLEAHVRRLCTIQQAKLQNASQGALTRPCGCYATRTLRAFDAAETEFFRANGYFNDTARAKALAAIDSCRLQRPA